MFRPRDTARGTSARYYHFGFSAVYAAALGSVGGSPRGLQPGVLRTRIMFVAPHGRGMAARLRPLYLFPPGPLVVWLVFRPVCTCTSVFALNVLRLAGEDLPRWRRSFLYLSSSPDPGAAPARRLRAPYEPSTLRAGRPRPNIRRLPPPSPGPLAVRSRSWLTNHHGPAFPRARIPGPEPAARRHLGSRPSTSQPP